VLSFITQYLVDFCFVDFACGIIKFVYVNRTLCEHSFSLDKTIISYEQMFAHIETRRRKCHVTRTIFICL